MSRYHCPACGDVPRRLQRRRRGVQVCGICGGRLQAVGMGWWGPALAITVALAGVGLAAIPDLIDGAASLAVGQAGLPALLEQLEPPPQASERPTALLQGPLFKQLRAADREWQPTAETLPSGGIRYLYKRRLGEPELSIAEIRDRMAFPPSHDQERQAIVELLKTLQAAKVRLVLTEPKKPGAAGEWDHDIRTMRIDPIVARKGTVEFARVLNHEAIHVAQSCSNGRLGARPKLLGLEANLDAEMASQLKDPLYAGASPEEQALEREAYASQNDLSLGASLVRIHCPLASEG